MIVGSRDDYAETAGQIVSRGPAHLLGATLAAGGVDAEAIIYDGITAAGRRVATIRAVAGMTERLDEGGGNSTALGTGIFVVVTGAGARLSVARVGANP